MGKCRECAGPMHGKRDGVFDCRRCMTTSRREWRERGRVAREAAGLPRNGWRKHRVGTELWTDTGAWIFERDGFPINNLAILALELRERLAVYRVA